MARDQRWTSHLDHVSHCQILRVSDIPSYLESIVKSSSILILFLSSAAHQLILFSATYRQCNLVSAKPPKHRHRAVIRVHTVPDAVYSLLENIHNLVFKQAASDNRESRAPDIRTEITLAPGGPEKKNGESSSRRHLLHSTFKFP